MISAYEALERLQDGNRRFVCGKRRAAPLRVHTPGENKACQRPFAIVLGCSDSRVPAEIVFDQGLGDLFVVRVAGHIAARSQVGSIEFAATGFGTRLIVVLGHSECGAVLATLEELQHPSTTRSRNVRVITDKIRLSLQPVLETGMSPRDLVAEAVRAHIRGTVNQLRARSSVLRQLSRTDGLLIAGAEYSLDSGVVEFLNGPAAGIKGNAGGEAGEGAKSDELS